MTTKLTIEKLWSLDGFKPTDNQREAILHTDGPLLITAGPGSGKTRVLLWRAVNLIVFYDHDPQDLFLSTFTEKAALQLKQGLTGLLSIVTNITEQPYDLSKMALGTVHSICLHILTERRFSKLGMRTRPPALLDELSQYFYLSNNKFWENMARSAGFKNAEMASSAINEYFFGKPSISKHYAVSNCQSLFNRFSEEYLVPAEIKIKGSSLSFLLKMYDYYLQSLASERLTDLSLLQQKALDVINANEKNGKAFKHIIIDEYQDTNTVQEKIFFNLSKGYKNICVVGDDDQALYRFRGATVENLVEFESRIKKAIGIKPKVVNLDINFRSKKQIIDNYTSFINKVDWKGDGGKYYRIIDKNIKPLKEDKLTTVVVSSHDKPDAVYDEIASFIKQLKANNVVEDYNQIAFLFPAMKGITKVKGLRDALVAKGIKVYAPRAGRFLEVEESVAVFGLLLKIFGRPKMSYSSEEMRNFIAWMKGSLAKADELCDNDPFIKLFIKDRKTDIEGILKDYEILREYLRKHAIELNEPFKLPLARKLSEIYGLSAKAKKSLSNHAFLANAKKRIEQGRPLNIRYAINRATSLDWTVLDLFYQFAGFSYFRALYDLAESGKDEGPICNLAQVSQYLSRFMEEKTPMITAEYILDNKFIFSFFSNYCYTLFRRQESEYEDVENPFPKGRVPFLTIHQSKGLEFPVVVLGSVFKREKGEYKIESIIRSLLDKKGEPLDRISEYDNARMFYVGLSRAKNLLVMPRYKGPSAVSGPFVELLNKIETKIQDIDITSIQKAEADEKDLGKIYSYTADYLLYNKCPRNYMFFRKYGFVPSRSQTMLFGSVVHQTIEDLHHFLIALKEKKHE